MNQPDAEVCIPIDASEQIERYVNPTTLVESWLDALAGIALRGAA